MTEVIYLQEQIEKLNKIAIKEEERAVILDELIYNYGYFTLA